MTPGVVLVASNTGTGLVVETRTDEAGRVTLPQGVFMRSPNPDDVDRARIPQWNIAYERRLPGNISAEIAYVGTRTDGGYADLNINYGEPAAVRAYGSILRWPAPPPGLRLDPDRLPRRDHTSRRGGVQHTALLPDRESHAAQGCRDRGFREHPTHTSLNFMLFTPASAESGTNTPGARAVQSGLRVQF